MILLDTHVWLWLLHDPSRLSDTANRQIADEEARVPTTPDTIDRTPYPSTCLDKVG